MDEWSHPSAAHITLHLGLWPRSTTFMGSQSQAWQLRAGPRAGKVRTGSEKTETTE
ncbi:Undecaprenyl-diphosphatase, partial [Clarias magur]